MIYCGHTTSMFHDADYVCTRGPGHKGRHQHMFEDKPRPQVWKIAQWGDSGGSIEWWTPEHTDCPQCGALHRHDSHRGGTPDGPCFYCRLWNERVTAYQGGDIMVIDGTMYTWGPEHGYGGRTFTITHKGETVTRRGLWCGGTIPWEYRPMMADNAAFVGATPM